MTNFMRHLAIGLVVVLVCALHGGQGRAQGEIGAIGRIMPSGGMVNIGGPPGAIVRAVSVRPGDTVRRGDLLLTVEDEATRSELDLAALDLQNATKLSEERALAQTATLRLAQVRLRRAERDLAAYQAIGRNATSEKEQSRLEAAVEEARQGIDVEQAKQRLMKAEGESSVKMATKRLESIQHKGLSSEVRAPSEGTILRVERRVGERLGSEPAIQMADLRVMSVACQVHEGDLLKLTAGMRATIKSAALAQPLAGTVEQISRLIDTRSRLGEVTIRLQNAEPASRLIGMEVEVVITR